MKPQKNKNFRTLSAMLFALILTSLLIALFSSCSKPESTMNRKEIPDHTFTLEIKGEAQIVGYVAGEFIDTTADEVSRSIRHGDQIQLQVVPPKDRDLSGFSVYYDEKRYFYYSSTCPRDGWNIETKAFSSTVKY